MAAAERTPLLRRFRRDARGVSALEFALVAPLLVAMFLATSVLCEALLAQRRASHVASALGDLVAQATQPLHDSDMNDIWSAAHVMMQPFPTDGLQLRLTSITADANRTAKVDWSNVPAGQVGLQPLTTGSTVTTLPTGVVVNAGDSVVMAEARYHFVSPSNAFLTNGLDYSEVFYLKPRQGTTIQRQSP